MIEAYLARFGRLWDQMIVRSGSRAAAVGYRTAGSCASCVVETVRLISVSDLVECPGKEGRAIGPCFERAKHMFDLLDDADPLHRQLIKPVLHDITL